MVYDVVKSEALKRSIQTRKNKQISLTEQESMKITQKLNVFLPQEKITPAYLILLFEKILKNSV